MISTGAVHTGDQMQVNSAFMSLKPGTGADGAVRLRSKDVFGGVEEVSVIVNLDCPIPIRLKSE